MWWPLAADGSPLLQARKQGVEALTKEIDQVHRYIQVILHKGGECGADVYSLCFVQSLTQQLSWIAVWLDMYHDVVRLAMVDLDRKIDVALMYNSGEKKMW